MEFKIVGETQKKKYYLGSPLFLSTPKDWYGITRRVHGIAAGVWHHAPACILLRIDSIQGLRLDSIPQTSCGFHTRLRRDCLKLHFYRSHPIGWLFFCFLDHSACDIMILISSAYRLSVAKLVVDEEKRA